MTQLKPKQLEFKPMYEKHDETDKEVWFICDIPELGIEYDWEFKSKSILVNINPFSNAFVGHADTIEQANDLINADFGKRWQAMSEPQPFWKPIEQCPKEKLVNYLLHNSNTGALSVGYWNDGSWSGVHVLSMLVIKGATSPTHYAEIPPLEASNAKV